jgi:hypothetical protein
MVKWKKMIKILMKIIMKFYNFRLLNMNESESYEYDEED